MMPGRKELLQQIQAIEFMALELNLYLDTHPEDHRALCEYNQYTRQLKALKDEFQRSYGPLSNFGTAFSQFPWRWIQDPWPWEEE